MVSARVFVVLLGKTPYCHIASLHPGVYLGVTLMENVRAFLFTRSMKTVHKGKHQLVFYQKQLSKWINIIQHIV